MPEANNNFDKELELEENKVEMMKENIHYHLKMSILIQKQDLVLTYIECYITNYVEPQIFSVMMSGICLKKQDF